MAVSVYRAPVVVIGPPKMPYPLPTLVTVPPLEGLVLVIVLPDMEIPAPGVKVVE